jgi:exodeoxyribonuclease X
MSSTIRIRVVDLETTGEAPPEHWPCEIGWVDVVGTPFAGGRLWEVDGGHVSTLCDPGREIPPETMAIHHITNSDVEHSMTWPAALSLFSGMLPPDAYAGHGIKKADRHWLTDEVLGPVPWICTYKCSMRVWPEAPGHSNQALRYWRVPAGLDRALAHPTHRAGPDAYVTAFHVRELLETTSLEQLVEWSGQPVLQRTCRIGQWRGKPWSEVDDGFLTWVLGKDFDEDVIFTVKAERARRHAEWEARQADGSARALFGRQDPVP